jgi:undecaprenyl-diphosphatase
MPRLTSGRTTGWGTLCSVPRLARWRRSPVLTLVVLPLAFGVVLGCAVLAGEVLKQAESANGATAFDSSITRWMVAHRDHVLTVVARVLSAIGSQKVLAPVAAVAAVLLIGRRRVAPAVFLAVAWGGAILLYTLTKHIVLRPRPPVDIRLMRVGASSFPSGHATQSLATFVALATLAAVAIVRGRAAAGIALSLGLAAAVGWSRVYLGVHWSTDVIAGWLVGAAWVSSVLWLSGRSSASDDAAPPDSNYRRGPRSSPTDGGSR